MKNPKLPDFGMSQLMTWTLIRLNIFGGFFYQIYGGVLMIVSHDRYFIGQVNRPIILLWKKKGFMFKNLQWENYSSYRLELEEIRFSKEDNAFNSTFACF